LYVYTEEKDKMVRESVSQPQRAEAWEKWIGSTVETTTSRKPDSALVAGGCRRGRPTFDMLMGDAVDPAQSSSRRAKANQNLDI
jgi:hypothetical protein